MSVRSGSANIAQVIFLCNVGSHVFGQHCTGKNVLQCCLNTPGTILHRKNSMQYCPRGSRHYCTGKNSEQCCLNNNIWPLFCNFDFGPVAANAAPTLLKLSHHYKRKILRHLFYIIILPFLPLHHS